MILAIGYGYSLFDFYIDYCCSYWLWLLAMVIYYLILLLTIVMAIGFGYCLLLMAIDLGLGFVRLNFRVWFRILKFCGFT